MQAILGLHPTGTLRVSKIAPGDFVRPWPPDSKAPPEWALSYKGEEEMKRVIPLVYASYVLALLALPAKAQEWSAEQLEVWELVSRVSDLEMVGDDAWMDLLHESFQS